MSADHERKVYDAAMAVLEDSLAPIVKTDNRITTLYTVSGFCFCFAILLLAIIGAARLF